MKLYWEMGIAFLSLLFLFGLNGCITIPHAPKSIAPTTLIISEPENFNCFVNHQDQGAPTTKISLFVNIIIYYFNGNRKVQLDEVSITIDPNITPFPISVVAMMPSDGGNAITELNIEGTTCSECANGWSLPTETPYSACPNILVTSTNPWSYIAAIPRWKNEYFAAQYRENSRLGPAIRISNKPNSCGCTVQ